MSVVTSFKPLGSDQPQLSVTQTPEQTSGIVGQIVAINDQGQALVNFPGAAGSPRIARSLLSDHSAVVSEALPLSVFLLFEQSDPEKPLIAGLINESPFTAKPAEQPQSSGTLSEQPQDVLVDGKRLTITAQDEILLRCGKSSILLRRDGKVVIKGENLISRSAASNKIKGSSVSIN